MSPMLGARKLHQSLGPPTGERGEIEGKQIGDRGVEEQELKSRRRRRKHGLAVVYVKYVFPL